MKNNKEVKVISISYELNLRNGVIRDSCIDKDATFMVVRYEVNGNVKESFSLLKTMPKDVAIIDIFDVIEAHEQEQTNKNQSNGIN